MSITLVTARQNRTFKGRLELLRPAGQGAYVLPQAAATYEMRLFRHNNTVPFATGTIGNGKIAITAAAVSTVVTWNFPAGDMQGLLGYGSFELISTIDNVPVCVPPIQFVKEDTPYTQEYGERLVVFSESVVCVVQSLPLDITLVPGIDVMPKADTYSLLAARHLIQN